MARTPHNVLVLPYRRGADAPLFAVFRRADDPGTFWQVVAGGVEDGETVAEAAARELIEETGLSAPLARWTELDAKASVPRDIFRSGAHWGPEVYVVQVHAFAVDVSDGSDIALSHEHTEFKWLGLAEATRRVRHDSDKTALWELNARLAQRRA